MNIIQRSVFPKINLCTEQDLYFRVNEFASLDLKNSIILKKMEEFLLIHILIVLQLENGKITQL